jgi:hypothetical protein
MFNLYQREMGAQFSYSMLFGGVGGTASMLYYIITKPLTKNLYMEGVKSLVLGTLMGLGYNRVQQYFYNEKIHQIYLVGLQRTRGLKHV